jgi:predicted ATP-grasp superfamily ATP-dependent carboligase
LRILVIGINVRHIAASACRAGHEVYAVDGYCDRDLARWAVKTALLPRQGAEQEIPRFVDMFEPDALVLGPGLEEASVAGVPVLNNPPARTAQVSDKLWLAGWLEESGFACIRTVPAAYAGQALQAGSLSYPFVVKPRRGAGGVGCRVVHGPKDLTAIDKPQRAEESGRPGEEKGEQEIIAQQLVSGLPSSVSVIGNGCQARAVAVNEQLIGLSWAGAKGFRYSGNITPLAARPGDLAAMASAAEQIVAGLGLLGSNGVDFLLTEGGPVAVEVNSRFQGSMDCVEMAAGCNIFSAHLQAFSGGLPGPLLTPGRTAGRIILYAPRDLTVRADLCREWTADVPDVMSRIAADDPLLSITARGRSRDQVMALLQRRTEKMMRLLAETHR